MQQQQLVAKEQRLKYLKQQEYQHHQMASEYDRLRRSVPKFIVFYLQTSFARLLSSSWIYCKEFKWHIENYAPFSNWDGEELRKEYMIEIFLKNYRIMAKRIYLPMCLWDKGLWSAFLGFKFHKIRLSFGNYPTWNNKISSALTLPQSAFGQRDGCSHLCELVRISSRIFPPLTHEKYNFPGCEKKLNHRSWSSKSSGRCEVNRITRT